MFTLHIQIDRLRAFDANTPSGNVRTDIYYGVYFYPYTKPGIDPVFAAVGGQEVLQPSPADPFTAPEHAFFFLFEVSAS